MAESTDCIDSAVEAEIQGTEPKESFIVENEEEEEDTTSQSPSDELILDEMAELKLKDDEDQLTDEEKQNKRAEAERIKEEGNTHFRVKDFQVAIQSYSAALAICPLMFPETRAILYSNRGTAKSKVSDITGAIEDHTKAIELQPNYVKALLRRAQHYDETDKLDEALADYEKVLAEQPKNEVALTAAHSLKPRIAERNEKLKAEMMGKLKDLGNMILRPFGLSTNNFNFVQDPNTGGYSE